MLLLPVCSPAYQVPSGTRSTLKGKNFLSEGVNSYVLEKTPFPKESKTVLTVISP